MDGNFRTCHLARFISTEPYDQPPEIHQTLEEQAARGNCWRMPVALAPEIR